MAIESETSFVGARLAELRRRRGLTAADLAERVPSDSFTKTVVTNVESGRKRDLTVTELIQVAGALQVPVVALVVDTDHPWDPVALPGLVEELRGLSNVEYALRAGFLNSDGGFSRFDARLIEDLVRAEELVEQLRSLVLPITDHHDGGVALQKHLRTSLAGALSSLAVLRGLMDPSPAILERIDRVTERARDVQVNDDGSPADASQ